jgi:hypothetical protein
MNNNDAPDWETLQEEITGENPMICSHCQKRKVYIYTTIKSKRTKQKIKYQRHRLRPEKIPNKQVA